MNLFISCIQALLILIGGLVVMPKIVAQATAEKSLTQSQCVACHTDVKGLIRLSWEVEKLRPKPVQSAEISGEG
jgi:hypothetical protein